MTTYEPTSAENEEAHSGGSEVRVLWDGDQPDFLRSAQGAQRALLRRVRGEPPAVRVAVVELTARDVVPVELHESS